MESARRENPQEMVARLSCSSSQQPQQLLSQGGAYKFPWGTESQAPVPSWLLGTNREGVLGHQPGTEFSLGLLPAVTQQCCYLTAPTWPSGSSGGAREGPPQARQARPQAACGAVRPSPSPMCAQICS